MLITEQIILYNNDSEKKSLSFPSWKHFLLSFRKPWSQNQKHLVSLRLLWRRDAFPGLDLVAHVEPYEARLVQLLPQIHLHVQVVVGVKAHRLIASVVIMVRVALVVRGHEAVRADLQKVKKKRTINDQYDVLWTPDAESKLSCCDLTHSAYFHSLELRNRFSQRKHAITQRGSWHSKEQAHLWHTDLERQHELPPTAFGASAAERGKRTWSQVCSAASSIVAPVDGR